MFLVLLFAVTLFIGEGTAYPTTISEKFFALNKWRSIGAGL